MDKAEKIAEKIHSQLYRNKGQQIEIKIITEALKEYAGEAVKKYKALEGGAVDDEEIKTAKKEKEHV